MVEVFNFSEDVYKNIMELVNHKSFFKGTTTKKFKQDLIDILSSIDFNGDFLEIGTCEGDTTAILGMIAKKKNKKVISFDISNERIVRALQKFHSFELDNIEVYVKDVYNEEWNVNNIGLVFVDCVHTEQAFESDINNIFKYCEDPIIIAHDYGLVTKDGDSIKPIIEKRKDLKIERFIGEKDNWNLLGSGTVIDWEGVILRRLK